MSANLSIINEDRKEDHVVIKTKVIGNTTSDDSGINSTTSTEASTSAVKNEPEKTSAGTKKTTKEIIIPFQALNVDERKESTFLANNIARSACNISNIDGSNAHKITIDSDGNYTT